jgi:hypothetical protein
MDWLIPPIIFLKNQKAVRDCFRLCISSTCLPLPRRPRRRAKRRPLLIPQHRRIDLQRAEPYPVRQGVFQDRGYDVRCQQSQVEVLGDVAVVGAIALGDLTKGRDLARLDHPQPAVSTGQCQLQWRGAGSSPFAGFAPGTADGDHSPTAALPQRDRHVQDDAPVAGDHLAGLPRHRQRRVVHATASAACRASAARLPTPPGRSRSSRLVGVTITCSTSSRTSRCCSAGNSCSHTRSTCVIATVTCASSSVGSRASACGTDLFPALGPGRTGKSGLLTSSPH